MSLKATFRHDLFSRSILQICVYDNIRVRLIFPEVYSTVHLHFSKSISVWTITQSTAIIAYMHCSFCTVEIL